MAGSEAERRAVAGSEAERRADVERRTVAGSEAELDPLAWPGPEAVLRPDFGTDLAGVRLGAGSGGPEEGGGLRRGLVVSAVATLVMILLGIPLGLIWSAVAPGVPVVQTENGALLAQPQPEEFIAADGWFSLLGFGLGVLVAIAVWLVLRRYRGPLGMLLVVLGMIGAAVLAWQVGRHIGLAGYERLLQTAPPGETFTKPPDLHGGQFEMVLGFIPRIQDLLVPAFGAAVMYTLLAGWSRYPGLRPEAEDAPGVPAPAVLSWDLPVPPGPSATPAPPGPDAAEPPRG
ncbi:DUF2567 domain-containing protein [Plantactinospora sp. S1510]|uniref:DUF2567 domain-containing protein n=1 Tax=Plantactinospora alkalitolerans TaxID=2789879 RepID=A0ABS0H617_9ACTN|nr:DUF2567 domain-containing protein [Plantactinospora alkalitolerans]MBF9133584.1 DUF2567 domain-containing protein [Plantactinospora alkalitolerans]